MVALAVAGLAACGARTELAGPVPPIDVTPDAGGGGPPPARDGGGGGDPTARVLLFGGAQHRIPDFGILGDSWTWNDAGWSQVATQPPARVATAMARLGDRAVLFGGLDANGSYLDDTWEWDGAWHAREVAGPPARAKHSMVAWDGAVYLQGGRDTHGDFTDTWKWDGTTWTKISDDGPDLTEGGMAALSSAIVALTGPPADDLEHDATWRFDGAHWSALGIDGPPPRTEFAMAALGDEAIVFGGYAATYEGGGALVGDTWQFDGHAWQAVDVAGPSPRALPVMVSTGDALLLYGGLVGEEGVDDAWRFDGSAWTSLGEGSPGPRYSAAMVEL